MIHRVALFLIGVSGLILLTKEVFAHGVHSGISGCPVGACGPTSWSIANTAFDTVFQISLITYSMVFVLLGYFVYQKKSIFRISRKTKNRAIICSGIFMMIFGVDGFLLLDSTIPECKGFAGMSLFVFVTLGFDSRAISSNPECFGSFVGQIISGILFTIGLVIIMHRIIKRQKRIQNLQKIV